MSICVSMYELYYNNSLNIIMVAFRFFKVQHMNRNMYRMIYSMLHHHKTQYQLFTLRRMALALALIKQMLKFENSSKDASDFGSELFIASIAMTCARKFDASLPRPIGVNC